MKVLPIRLKLDVYYVKYASFFGDLKLIIWTVLAILYTACGKYPQWMHDHLVAYSEQGDNGNVDLNLNGNGNGNDNVNVNDNLNEK